tara:strand:+ start:3221 stop:3385 length:165 start_codon:yes stop_codon:yes gene_type:complete
MSSIKIKVRIDITDEIEIDAEDLMHQSIDDYMDDVRYNLHDYVCVDSGFEWEIE